MYDLEPTILRNANNHFYKDGSLVELNFFRAINALHRVMEASHTARHEGLLALEDYAKTLVTSTNFENAMFKTALFLIVDGIDPEFVRNILQHKLIVKGLDTFDAFLGYLVSYGALCLQVGENPRLIEEELLSCFPDELIQKIKDALHKKHSDLSEEHTAYQLNQWKTQPPRESDCFFLKVFEKRFAQLNDREVQRVFRELDWNHIMQIALFCSKQIRTKIENALSERMKVFLMDEYWFLDESGLNESLNIVMKTIEKLEYTGEISEEVERS